MAGTGTPPTPDGVPLLGNGLAFARDPFGAVERWASLGDVVRLRAGGASFYLVTDPSLVKRVLVHRHDAFTISERQRTSFEGVEDNAVTTTTGERWRR